MKPLTHERLLEVLRYIPESGLFYWIRPPKQHPRMRDYTAGGITTGYATQRHYGSYARAA